MSHTKKVITDGMEIGQQTFIFFPACVRPQNNKPILIKFKKKGARTKTFLVQGTFKKFRYAAKKHQWPGTEEFWLDYKCTVISEKIKSEVHDYTTGVTIVEWAYI